MVCENLEEALNELLITYQGSRGRQTIIPLQLQSANITLTYAAAQGHSLRQLSFSGILEEKSQAGICVRQVEDITVVPWRSKVSPRHNQ